MTILKESGLLELLEDDEFMLADKAYIGEKHCLCPFKGKILDDDANEWNLTLSKKRVIVEHTFGKMKKFRCLKIVWRHNFDLHRNVFQLIGNFVNISILIN